MINRSLKCLSLRFIEDQQDSDKEIVLISSSSSFSSVAWSSRRVSCASVIIEDMSCLSSAISASSRAHTHRHRQTRHSPCPICTLAWRSSEDTTSFIGVWTTDLLLIVFDRLEKDAFQRRCFCCPFRWEVMSEGAQLSEEIRSFQVERHRHDQCQQSRERERRIPCNWKRETNDKKTRFNGGNNDNKCKSNVLICVIFHMNEMKNFFCSFLDTNLCVVALTLWKMPGIYLFLLSSTLQMLFLLFSASPCPFPSSLSCRDNRSTFTFIRANQRFQVRLLLLVFFFLSPPSSNIHFNLIPRRFFCLPTTRERRVSFEAVLDQ